MPTGQDVYKRQVVDTTSVADKDTAEKAGTLRVGLVADSLSHAVNVTGSSLPWRQSPNNVWSSVKTFQTDGMNGKLAPVTMAQWFANASSNFTTFDGSYLDTSNCTSFEQMFYNDTALLEITGTGSWSTSKVTTFAGMFQNVTQVREYFMDSWNMRGTVGGANANVSNMFNNAQAVWRLHIGPGMILQGTGLTELVNLSLIHI